MLSHLLQKNTLPIMILSPLLKVKNHLHLEQIILIVKDQLCSTPLTNLPLMTMKLLLGTMVEFNFYLKFLKFLIIILLKNRRPQ